MFPLMSLGTVLCWLLDLWCGGIFVWGCCAVCCGFVIFAIAFPLGECGIYVCVCVSVYGCGCVWVRLRA